MPVKEVKSQKSKVASGLSVPVYSLAGKESGILVLPKEVFGQKINKQLLSQAIRVYAANQKTQPGSTKTRGEVTGSTAKIFRQKGTGRARHGSVRAPIFVGGGIALGPKPRKVRLDLPKKMKKAALFSALSAKLADKRVLGINGLDKASGKTKEVAKFMEAIKTKSALLVTGDRQVNAVRAARNIEGVDILPVNMINTYEVIKHNVLVLTKEAVEKIKI